jgi:hypothetical protein
MSLEPLESLRLRSRLVGTRGAKIDQERKEEPGLLLSICAPALVNEPRYTTLSSPLGATSIGPEALTTNRFPRNLRSLIEKAMLHGVLCVNLIGAGEAYFSAPIGVAVCRMLDMNFGELVIRARRRVGANV